MTRTRAREAMEFRYRVCAGETPEDYDTGYVVHLQGDTAVVAWDSGVTTPCPVADLWPFA